MTNEKEEHYELLKNLIGSTIDLADSADPSGKLSKHMDAPTHDAVAPHIPVELLEYTADWILDAHDSIGEQIHQTRLRLFSLAQAVDDGDEAAFGIAKNVLRELSSEFGETDEDQ
jgi:hypothetical protein